MEFNLRVEFTNVFNRAYWGDPTGTALTNAALQQVRFTSGATNGNTSTGFGRVLTTERQHSSGTPRTSYRDRESWSEDFITFVIRPKK